MTQIFYRQHQTPKVVPPYESMTWPHEVHFSVLYQTSDSLAVLILQNSRKQVGVPFERLLCIELSCKEPATRI